MNLTATVIAAVAVFTAVPAAAVTYDAFTGFSTASNPNGAYTYGYESTLGGALTLFTTPGAPSATPDSWTSPSIDRYLGVYKLSSSLLQHPGPSGEYSVLRVTVATAGRYKIAGSYANGDNATTDVHVLTDNTSVFDGAINGNGSSAPFAFIKTLAAGSTVDFAVGNGGNGYFNDSTLTGATVASVPEPAAWALMIVGFGMVGFAARRRTNAVAA